MGLNRRFISMTINRFAELAHEYLHHYVCVCRRICCAVSICSTSQFHYIKLYNVFVYCTFNALSWRTNDVRATIFDLLWTAHVTMRWLSRTVGFILCKRQLTMYYFWNADKHSFCWTLISLLILITLRSGCKQLKTV